MKPLGLPDPRRIGPYRIFAQLGRGGMGRVYLAGAPDGRLVALKLVHAQHVEEPGFRERFRREVAASRRVSGAYTAPVVDADVETEIPWLVTVFVPGPSLRQAVEAAGPLPPETAARLAAGLAAALGEIHAAGLVHRDLKPSNVLLAADGPRVIDFGVARATDGNTSELTHTGWLVGSPGYMSPEQAESKALTPASDVFSLGAVVYMACTGTEPFMGASTPATLYNVVHAEPDLDAVPDPLRGVIAACLAKDPEARPTPEEVLARIGDVPAVTRTWPDAVHALITEQNEAVVEALRDGGAPLDVAVVPLLPEDPISATGATSATGVQAATGVQPPEGATVAGNGNGNGSSDDSSNARENSRGDGRGDGGSGDRGSSASIATRDRRPRRALTALLAVAALAVGGTAAALVTGSGGAPTAADAQSSSTAQYDPATSDSASTPDPTGAPSDTEAPIAGPLTPEPSVTDPNATDSRGGDPNALDPSATATRLSDQSASKAPTSAAPACLGTREAYDLAKQRNGGSLPSDAKVSILKCDRGWAAGRLTSVSYGDAAIVYEYDGAAWSAVDLGTEVCGGVVTGAPSDVRKSLNC